MTLSACAPADPEQTPVIVGHDIRLASDVRVLAARVAPGATLSSLLRAHNVAEREIAALVERTKAVFDVRAIRTDQPYRLARALTGALRRFEYEIDHDRVLTVHRGDEQEDFVAVLDPIEQRTELTVVQGALVGEGFGVFDTLSWIELVRYMS